ncbi:MAG: transporter [Myxococcaceae bacterium]|nr:transporter [Myxococcaceae bacterium]
MGRGLRRALFAVLLVGGSGLSAPALACPTCTCGNPAMTAMGAEQPFSNRVRLAATARAWEQTQGVDGLDAVRLREVRLDLTGSWSPTDWFTLSMNLPLQLREQREVNLAREVAAGLGDADVAARFVVAGRGRMRPPALVSVIAGARLPTSPTLFDRDRRALSLDAQLGPGSLAPQLGVAWSGFFGDRWSAMASLLGELPLQGRFGFRLGPSAVLVSLAQFQPVRWLGVRAGVDARVEGPSLVDGRADPSLSGFLGSALADVVFGLGSRVLLLVGVRAPLVDLRVGPVRTLPILVSSVVVDL